ncbi:DUF2769 domain-containing protein [Methanobacterium sp. MBAC-LM]|uniref:DUF2769 domain-containing protein n=1 Tax=Methanobacterium sp. MBAC-LM TaxID=3412034 RepID=UPI003C764F60
MVNIDFNKENIRECLCPRCPVQAKSVCPHDKLIKLQSQKEPMPDPEEVPGIYCSTGKATCEGLDPSQMCQCNKCEIWKEHNLGEGEPGSYYCAKGEAR